MKEKKRLMVLLAACNGEKYLPAQLESIQRQLLDEDLILVGLDPSSDSTGEILRQAEKADPRIRVIRGPGKGASSNFEMLLKEARQQIRSRNENPENVLIALSDQDDLWRPEKAGRIRELFSEPGRQLVVHDAGLIDADGRSTSPSFFSMHRSKNGFLNNLIRNSFIGCCMAFRSDLIDRVIPFPEDIPMHDQWIGMRALQTAKDRDAVFFDPEVLMDYRRHENNATSMSHAGLLQMVKWRTALIRDLISAKKEKNR